MCDNCPIREVCIQKSVGADCPIDIDDEITKLLSE